MLLLMLASMPDCAQTSRTELPGCSRVQPLSLSAVLDRTPASDSVQRRPSAKIARFKKDCCPSRSGSRPAARTQPSRTTRMATVAICFMLTVSREQSAHHDRIARVGYMFEIAGFTVGREHERACTL